MVSLELETTNTEVENGSIQGWFDKHKIVNEKGELMTFHKHLYLLAIYEDQSDCIIVMKAAQMGLSTLEILKNFHDAHSRKMDIIYTLPTDSDVGVFVGGKVNRIISNNPILSQYTSDKDTIEQKQIGQSMIYFRGTFTKKAAIMITADRLVHDEKDSSKQDVIADFRARLQHSKYKQIHVFSHPSVPNNGVDVEWQLSDQKEWFVTCPHCSHKQFLSWNTEDPKKMSIDLETRQFVCKKCHGVLSWKDRAVGEWVAKHKDRKWSGYHISLLMSPDTSAGEIIDKYNEVLSGKQTMDYFYNKVLGLVYSGSGNSVTQDLITGAVTDEKNSNQGRMVIGVDTGVKLRYVVGNKQGLMGYGEMTDYTPDEVNKLPLDKTLEYFLKKFPTSIMVIDQGGDIIGSRKLKQKYPGRVFLCHYSQDRKTMQLIRWGDKDEFGNVLADRNRMIQLVIDELREKRIRLYNGTESDWYDYWLHWSHIYRVSQEDQLGVTRNTWMRSDRDDWVHATVYWRIGVSRFGDSGSIALPMERPETNGVTINPDQTVELNPDDIYGKSVEEEEDWR
jgi:DNA-directed RNA polymerase subunit RPC12/RpoP